MQQNSNTLPWPILGMRKKALEHFIKPQFSYECDIKKLKSTDQIKHWKRGTSSMIWCLWQEHKLPYSKRDWKLFSIHQESNWMLSKPSAVLHKCQKAKLWWIHLRNAHKKKYHQCISRKSEKTLALGTSHSQFTSIKPRSWTFSEYHSAVVVYATGQCLHGCHHGFWVRCVLQSSHLTDKYKTMANVG